ncbi:MAG: hypothetical protein REI94_02330 [Moraxellaceae bacterium]|nr:hypothetical protein [Moraxellaceae bacterium]
MDWRYNTIWFDQLPDGDMAHHDFGKPPKPAAPFTAPYVTARSFKSAGKDMRDFPATSALRYLHLTLGNLTCFEGLDRFPGLRRLELGHCLKLEHDAGLEQVKDSLEWLHIDQSRKFRPGGNLLQLTQLRVLCLNDCGSLPDLSFLEAFPRLLDFRFVGTNVEDGDLTPLLRHPTLCSAGFLNKRHYNLKSVQVEQVLRPRHERAIALAHKGPYETWRYLALSDELSEGPGEGRTAGQMR